MRGRVASPKAQPENGRGRIWAGDQDAESVLLTASGISLWSQRKAIHFNSCVIKIRIVIQIQGYFTEPKNRKIKKGSLTLKTRDRRQKKILLV